jgi:hypothetical protein
MFEVAARMKKPAASVDDTTAITVEIALQRARDRAALLQYAADLAAASPEHPEPGVLSGRADLCGDIAETLAEVRGALDVDGVGRSYGRM